jgi:hypothetical protein
LMALEFSSFRISSRQVGGGLHGIGSAIVWSTSQLTNL